MTKSNEATPREFWIEVKSFSSSIMAAYDEKPGEVTYRIAKDVIHVIEYSAYEVLEAKCAKYEEIISYLPKVPTQPYEKELAIKCAKYDVALNNIDDHIRQMRIDKIIDMKEMCRALKVISDALAKEALE